MKFIVGLKNKSVQVEILKEGNDDLTLEGAVEISLKKSSPDSDDISRSDQKFLHFYFVKLTGLVGISMTPLIFI